VVPVDGGQQAKLFATSARSDTAPRWSPDGRWLAFLSDRGDDGRRQIWRQSADGGEAEKLTSAQTGVNGFKWSPDGRILAFTTRDERTDEEKRRKESWNDAIHVDQKEHYRRLWVIDPNDPSTALVTKTEIEINDFDWSPDGSSFAIAFSAVPGFLKDFDLSLGVVRRSDGTVVRKLADNVNLFWNSNVRWSPDGKTLLYLEAAPSRVGSWLSLIDSAGGVARPLLKDYPGTFWSADWAPDSRHVVAEFLSGSRAKLVRIDIGTGKIESLADILSGDADFSASADGRDHIVVVEPDQGPVEMASRRGMQSYSGLPARPSQGFSRFLARALH
jgi:Tol biopolymer transport system component